ncbi:hypothetical protein TNCV_2772021 [Trichonephila clavipes]|nr:hypothetical protein TNCV_2772021 [Trichonephila clavipes]
MSMCYFIEGTASISFTLKKKFDAVDHRRWILSGSTRSSRQTNNSTIQYYDEYEKGLSVQLLAIQYETRKLDKLKEFHKHNFLSLMS